MGVNQRAAVRMTDDEVAGFLERSRTATLATRDADDMPHLVAMWYGYFGGRVYFETKATSQKAVNLRRDPHLACLVEAGDTYDQLRGLSLEGTARIIEDPADEEYWAAAVNIFERYNGPYSDEVRPLVEVMMNKRIVVRVEPVRIRSWDHRKLGLPPIPLGGTTAAFLNDA